MRCLHGHTFPDDDPNAVQLQGKLGWLCGFHVDELLGKAPEPSTDSVGRAIFTRRKHRKQAVFRETLAGGFPPRKFE